MMPARTSRSSRRHDRERRQETAEQVQQLEETRPATSESNEIQNEIDSIVGPSITNQQKRRTFFRFMLANPNVSWYKAAAFYAHLESLATLGPKYAEAIQSKLENETLVNDRSKLVLDGVITQEDADKPIPTENKSAQVKTLSKNAIYEIMSKTTQVSDTDLFKDGFSLFIQSLNNEIEKYDFSCEITKHPLDPIVKIVTLRNTLEDKPSTKFSSYSVNEFSYFTHILNIILSNNDGTFEISDDDLVQLPTGSTLKQTQATKLIESYVEKGWLSIVRRPKTGSIQMPLYKVDRESQKAAESDIESMATIFTHTQDSIPVNIEPTAFIMKRDSNQVTLDMMGFTGGNTRKDKTIYTVGPHALVGMAPYIINNYSDKVKKCDICTNLCTFRYTVCNQCDTWTHNICLEKYMRQLDTVTASAAVPTKRVKTEAGVAPTAAPPPTSTAPPIESEWDLISRGPLTKESLDELEKMWDEHSCPRRGCKSSATQKWYNMMARKSQVLS